LAEAYCHQAHIYIELKKPALALASAEMAIKLLDKRKKPQWGDINRDPLWKAYAWKNTALHALSAPLKERQALEAEMKNRFPNHPGLKYYFGEKEGVRE